MKMKTAMIAALLALVTMTTFGQEAKKEKKATGYDTEMYISVKDHLTHEKVANVKGDLLLAADSSFVDTLTVENGDDVAYVSFHAKEPGKYIMRIHAEDYTTVCVSVDATKLHKREKYRELPTVYMRKQPKKLEVELDEVVVKSTLLKFYMDGDTLVYNADAFSMAEGSMLGDLIKKLPGVEVEDGGVIKVNGKPVETMLLNGKDFFNKDKELMLENMPSYMVKNFNVYERVPESAKGTPLENTAEKELVMDVRLKKEYNTGWIANAEVGGGATFYNNSDGRLDGKHLGRLFGLRFTDKTRMVAYVNANNLNDTKRPGDEGNWAQLRQTGGLTSTVSAGLNYRYDKDNEQSDWYYYEGSVDGSYTDKDDRRQTSSATFLDNGNTFGKSFSNSRSYNWEMNTEHRLTFSKKEVGNLMKNIYGYVRPEFNYRKWDNHASDGNVTLAEDVAAGLGKAWMDSIAAPDAGGLLKQYAINRTLSSRLGNGHQTEASAHAYIQSTPAYNDLMHFHISANGGINDQSNDTYEHYRLDYPADGTKATDYRNRYTPTRSKSQNLSLNPQMTFFIEREDTHWRILTFRYVYNYNHSDNNNPLYLLNRLEGWEQPDIRPLGMLPSEEELLTTMDWDNSSRNITTKHKHRPEIAYQHTISNNSKDTRKTLAGSIWIDITNERMDYQQGRQIDTLTTRNTALPNGQIMYLFDVPKKNRSYQVIYNYRTAAPNMTSLLNVRNDRDPLNISLGNPGLKNSTSHEGRFTYRDKLGKTLVNASANVRLNPNAVAYGFIYDRETGIRTTKPENVNGNWSAHADGGIDLPLDKHDKFRLKESMNYDYNHSVDLAGTNGAAEATRSTVGSHYLTDKLSLRYRPTSKMEFGVNGSLTYQHSTGNRESFQTLNVFTYHYGANAQLELPLGLQLSTDLTMYSRRGYSEPSMNTNELVWNARMAKKLLKGNLTLMFDGFDLLGNLSNVRRTINAQGRTETFYNVIPSYGLLHAIYRLNKQPKNKTKNQ